MRILRTITFRRWLSALRDRRAVARIDQRIERIEIFGQLGDWKQFGAVGELRVDYGPGYRVYFTRRGETVIVLLCGGDKDAQRRDIVRARELAAALESDDDFENL